MRVPHPCKCRSGAVNNRVPIAREVAPGSDQIGDSVGRRRSMSATFHRAPIARPGSFGVVRGHPPTSLDQGSRIYALVRMALFYVAKVGVAGSNPVVRSRSEALSGASDARPGPSIAHASLRLHPPPVAGGSHWYRLGHGETRRGGRPRGSAPCRLRIIIGDGRRILQRPSEHQLCRQTNRGCGIGPLRHGVGSERTIVHGLVDGTYSIPHHFGG